MWWKPLKKLRKNFENVVGQDSLTRFDQPKKETQTIEIKRKNLQLQKMHLKKTKILGLALLAVFFVSCDKTKSVRRV